jgi:hypothetical protein
VRRQGSALTIKNLHKSAFVAFSTELVAITEISLEIRGRALRGAMFAHAKTFRLGAHIPVTALLDRLGIIATHYWMYLQQLRWTVLAVKAEPQFAQWSAAVLPAQARPSASRWDEALFG